MRRRFRTRLGPFVLACVAPFCGGCKETPQAAPSRAPPEDPCAERLHELCGQLLLYHTLKHGLPAELDELRSLNTSIAKLPEKIECPVSRQPYVYEKNGRLLSGPLGRVIIRDATPVHAGHRWAIAIVEPPGGEPLVTRVVAVE